LVTQGQRIKRFGQRLKSMLTFYQMRAVASVLFLTAGAIAGIPPFPLDARITLAAPSGQCAP